MQEKITNSIIKKVVPIYGRMFKNQDLTVAHIEMISSDTATQKEKTEYYNYGMVAFKQTGVLFIIPFLLIFVGSVAIFRDYNIFLTIDIFIFCMLLSIGLTFELLALKKEDNRPDYTRKELIKGIIIGICSTIFFSAMLKSGFN